MKKFDRETALIAIELQQFIAEFGCEIDINGGRNITDYYHRDGVFVVGEQNFTGHDEIANFYAYRGELAQEEHTEGIRTARHTFTNFRYAIEDDDHATVYFFNINYGGDGEPPIYGPINPSAVSDCRMVLARDADGGWRIKLFDGEPIFIGKDVFMNKILKLDGGS